MHLLKKIKLSVLIFFSGIISTILVLALLYYIIYFSIVNYDYENKKNTAKIISEQTFSNMYKVMNKYWTRNELLEFLHEIDESNQKNHFKIYIHRSEIVDKQFGKLEYYPETLLRKSIEKQKFSKEEIKNEIFYYVKPLLAKEECLRCHTLAQKEDVLGVIEIQYDLSRELSDIRNTLFKIFFGIAYIPVLGSLIISFLLIYGVDNIIKKISRISSNIKSLSDLSNIDSNSFSLPFLEFQKVQKEIQDFVEKVQKVAVDKKILTTEMAILEKFIISSEAVKDWNKYIKKILLEIQQIIDFHFFYSVFKETDHKIMVYIFYFSEKILNFDNAIKVTITNEIKHSNFYLENIEILFIYELIHNSRKEEDNFFYEDLELKTITKSFFIDKPIVGGILGIGLDISDNVDEIKKLALESLLSTLVNVIGSVKAMNIYTRELEYYATRDPLTNLYNQRVFWDLLNYEVERAKRHNYSFALIVIDLDNFKIINDRYGHEIGDQYLKYIANIFRNVFRKEDILARYGGDEFVMILPYVDYEKLEKILSRTYQELNNLNLFIEKNIQIKCTFSVGAAIFPDSASTAKELFISADESMYLAKEEGKNCFRITSQFAQFDKNSFEKNISFLLNDALQNQENIIPFFQPIVDIYTKQIFAYEVLIRIKSLENIFPASRFIHVAEKMKIIQNLDFILFEKAVQKVINYNNKITLFFNISPYSFNSKDYFINIQDIIKKYNFSDIVFEITEREAIKDLNRVKEIIETLRKNKIRFALDDFGSGFSSYLYIKEIPVDFIKIEGNFIRTMFNNKVDELFVESIVKMAQSLGIQTIAEYVENETIYQSVKNSGIQYGQGFFFGYPSEEFANDKL